MIPEDVAFSFFLHEVEKRMLMARNTVKRGYDFISPFVQVRFRKGLFVYLLIFLLPDKIKELPQGEALLFLSGGQPLIL
jgi:hypothetical protein